jgi:hypothetical protein
MRTTWRSPYSCACSGGQYGSGEIWPTSSAAEKPTMSQNAGFT